MSILKLFKRIFLRKKVEEEAIESDLKRFKALEALEKRFESPIESLQALEQRFKSLESPPTEAEVPKKVEIERDSLQLGVVAGYAGKALKEIESSLQRIEGMVPTKEWLQFNLLTKLEEIKDKLESHDLFVKDKLCLIEDILLKLYELAGKLPKPYKGEMEKVIEQIEASLPLTPKMEALVRIVKESKEISYEELSQKLGITTSALRGLLSLTLRRTKELERFYKDGKGWVRFKALETDSSA